MSMPQAPENPPSDRRASVIFAVEMLVYPGYFGVRQHFPPKENGHTFPQSP